MINSDISRQFMRLKLLKLAVRSSVKKTTPSVKLENITLFSTCWVELCCVLPLFTGKKMMMFSTYLQSPKCLY